MPKNGHVVIRIYSDGMVENETTEREIGTAVSLPEWHGRPAKKAMCEVEGNGWTEHVMEYTDWRCHACGGFWTVCAGIGEAFDKYSFCPRCGAELT